MTISDLFLHKRSVDGYISPCWFWGDTHLSADHLQNIKNVFRLDKEAPEQDFHVLDVWSLHQNAAIVQGVWRLRNNNVYTELPSVCLSVVGKEAISLPYMVFSNESSSTKRWWEHPIARGWSPLKWWLANREDEAQMFAELCTRHITKYDWHLAGIVDAFTDRSVLGNLLQLSQPSRTLLPDQAVHAHYAF